jgi:hypothetical protein
MQCIYRHVKQSMIVANCRVRSCTLNSKMLPSSLELVLVAFILMLPFLYESSRAFRYYFKFFIYYGVVMTTAVVVIPIMMCRPKDVKNLLYVFANYNVHVQYSLLITLRTAVCYLFSNSPFFKTIKYVHSFFISRSIINVACIQN